MWHGEFSQNHRRFRVDNTGDFLGAGAMYWSKWASLHPDLMSRLLLSSGVLALSCAVAWMLCQKPAQALEPELPSQPASNAQPGAPPETPGIPTLSALLGQSPAVEFNAKRFFALAHHSPVTAEIERSIKIIAQQNSPSDKEAFYARFVGVGLAVYQHDTTWYVIFGSQLKALVELSSRGLIPIADLRKYYEKAAIEYPKTHKSYSFDQWLSFMKSRFLIATYPSQMVELSFMGQDFLKYLSHFGRNHSDRKS